MRLGAWKMRSRYCVLLISLWTLHTIKALGEKRGNPLLWRLLSDWRNKMSFHCWISWVFHLRSHKDSCHTGLGSYRGPNFVGHWCSVWDWCTCVGAGTKVRVSFCKELPMLRLAAWEWIYRLYGNIKPIDHKQIAGISDKEKSNSTWEVIQIAPLPFVF